MFFLVRTNVVVYYKHFLLVAVNCHVALTNIMFLCEAMEQDEVYALGTSQSKREYVKYTSSKSKFFCAMGKFLIMSKVSLDVMVNFSDGKTHQSGPTLSD